MHIINIFVVVVEITVDKDKDNKLTYEEVERAFKNVGQRQLDLFVNDCRVKNKRRPLNLIIV